MKVEQKQQQYQQKQELEAVFTKKRLIKAWPYVSVCESQELSARPKDFSCCSVQEDQQEKGSCRKP